MTPVEFCQYVIDGKVFEEFDPDDYPESIIWMTRYKRLKELAKETIAENSLCRKRLIANLVDAGDWDKIEELIDDPVWGEEARKALGRYNNGFVVDGGYSAAAH